MTYSGPAATLTMGSIVRQLRKNRVVTTDESRSSSFSSDGSDHKDGLRRAVLGFGIQFGREQNGISAKFEQIWNDGLIRVISPADLAVWVTMFQHSRRIHSGSSIWSNQRIFFTGLYDDKSSSGSTQNFQRIKQGASMNQILITNSFIGWELRAPTQRGKATGCQMGSVADGSAGSGSSA